jgi:integrase
MGRAATGSVEVRNGKLRLVFLYNGKKCYETLQFYKNDDKGMKSARATLAKIHEEMKHGVFKYENHFPNSPRVAEKSAGTTLTDYLDSWFRSKGDLASSTRDQYANDIKMWKRELGGEKLLFDLSVSHVREIIGSKAWPSDQRFNNAMTPLRGALDLARSEHKSLPDWLAKVPGRRRRRAEPYPVTQAEMLRILGYMKKNFSIKVWAYAAWMFATGMRPEEGVIQCWSDLRLDKKNGFHRTYVSRAKSFRGQISTTKTKSSRYVDLSPLALQALDEMSRFTEAWGKEIFLNPVTNKPWHDSRAFHENYWSVALKALHIKHRRSYATRHTFATLLLQAGARVAYVSAQMGHTTPTQVESTYHRWLPDADGGHARGILASAFGREEG